MASVSTTYSDFDLAERERIRQALLAYMREHKIGTPTLAERIKKSHPREMQIPLKTLQRTLGPLRPPKKPPDPKKPVGPTRTHDMALIICKAFVDKLPNKPMPFQALGEALHAIYSGHLDIQDGIVAVMAHDIEISVLTLTAQPGQKFLIAKEKTTSGHSIYDGVMVRDGMSNIFTILKDRLMHTVRIHAMHQNPNVGHVMGVIYDNGNLESGGIRYQDV